ncbi:Cleavage and polyadenylation specificity factor CPSF30, partial [Diplodia seriata]
SLPRGPPRKPRQSGHALWVGNLPPGTTVVDLKDHFSREASKDIESLFLISKSNCAFVNYKTEASCTAAMHRFHDSRFHGVRLVCRLRRSAAPASGVPTGPSAMSVPRQRSQSPERSASPHPPDPVTSDGDTIVETEEKRPFDGEPREDGPPAKVAEKFFVVKSLTLQDLELSVRNGIWATQSHNEDALNKAYDTAENVYLIFSANKSGEYFGYARMASPINDNGIDLIHSVPETQASETSDTPKSIPTPATEWAPKGRIIDDSARGTIFWEADPSEDEEEENKPDGSVQPVELDGPNTPQTWGKPFRIDWISTNRLPFYRTRGLRNPWNANREVKIARDGTELEPGVGKRLIQMFHRLGPQAAGPPAIPLMPMPGQMAGPQMRPF